MISIVVILEVDPARLEYFQECAKIQADASNAEAGCRRWEISRKLDQQNIFTLSELYDDAEALQAHLNSQHFKAWQLKTGDGLILSKTSVRGEVLSL